MKRTDCAILLACGMQLTINARCCMSVYFTHPNFLRTACDLGRVSSAASPRMAAAHTDANVSFPVTAGYGVCMTPGCNRAYLRTKHRHCCSMCRRGLHSPKCTDFQKALQGMKHKGCAVPDCKRMVNHGYATCCAQCVATAGIQHSEGCLSRQGLLRSQLGLLLHQTQE